MNDDETRTHSSDTRNNYYNISISKSLFILNQQKTMKFGKHCFFRVCGDETGRHEITI